MELAYTRHAREAMEKRGIAEDWVQRAAERPQRTEPVWTLLWSIGCRQFRNMAAEFCAWL